MIKPQVKRAITLLLAILLTLGTLAPIFTSFAASILEVTSKTAGVTVSGTPGREFTPGTYTFTVQEEPSGETVSLKSSPQIGESETVSAKYSAEQKTITYGGITFKKETSWSNSDSFEFEISEYATTGEPKLTNMKVTTAGSSSEPYKITRGRSIDLYTTIVDTNFLSTDTPSNAYVVFENGDFTQSTSASQGSKHTIEKLPNSDSGKLAFQINLKNLTYTGKGNTVKFTYGYVVNGERFEYSQTVTIPDCKEYVDKEDGSSSEDDTINLDPLTPHIIVSSYDYGTNQVVAGQTFNLDLNFENTSNQYDLDNIVMKVTTSEGFSITSSSNTFYFNHLNVDESINKTLSVQANPSAKAQSYSIDIEFSFQYITKDGNDNESRKSGTSSESISIPISQPDRFSIDEPQVPVTMYVGEESSVSVSFVNKGKADIYNVTAEIRGNFPKSGERTFIGNVTSGTEDSAEFYLTAEEPGTLDGEIVITYEDSNMNVKEVVKPFRVAVEEMSFVDPGIDFPVDFQPQPQEDPSKLTLPNIILGAVAVCVAGFSGYMTVLKIKAKRSDFDDEDL